MTADSYSRCHTELRSAAWTSRRQSAPSPNLLLYGNREIRKPGFAHCAARITVLRDSPDRDDSLGGPPVLISKSPEMTISLLTVKIAA